MKLMIFLCLVAQIGLASDPTEIVAPREGDKILTGRVPANAVSVAVDVLEKQDSRAPTPTINISEETNLVQLGNCATPCLNSGVFKITFTSGLAVGQIVRVRTFDAQNTQIGDPTQVTVASSTFDWGRARAYFSGGTVIAKSGAEFSSPSVYLGLNVDYNWLQTDWHKDNTSGGHAINTFFEARLTQVPVATGTGLPDLGIGANTILQSPQSGFVEAGAYAPFYFRSTRWQFHHSDNALFVAPLAEGGFQSVRQGTIDGLTADQASQAQIDGKDVYRFLAGGARIGHLKLPKQKGSSPELLSYIDVTVGRWDNLRTARPGLEPVGGAGFRYPLRFDAEGRLKIPYGPFFVGFGLNVGSGADDLRFLFGTRFDIGQLISTIVPSIR